MCPVIVPGTVLATMVEDGIWVAIAHGDPFRMPLARWLEPKRERSASCAWGGPAIDAAQAAFHAGP